MICWCSTYNEDRHFGNFGLLRDNRTGEITAPAPIFDNGLSLFALAMPDNYANLAEYAATRSPAYGNTTFEGICRSYITARQTEKLRRLLNFSFERHPKLNLPEKHLSAIEKHLRQRASQLIGLANERGRSAPPEPSLLAQLDEAKRQADATKKNAPGRGKTDPER